MKKFAVLLMAFVTVFSFCSCFVSEPSFVPARGEVEGYSYKNSAFGINFDINSNWIFYGDSEIAELMGVDISEVTNDPAESEAIYDMYCASVSTASTVNIIYEKTVLSEKAYLETTSAFLDGQFEASGAEVISKEISAVDINGEEKYCLDLEVSIMDIPIYEKVIVHRSNGWIGVITVAVLSEDEFDEILSGITFNLTE